MRSHSLVLCFLIITCSLGNLSAADDARIKETLRTLTLRLRSAETQNNTLLGDKAQLEQEKKTLTDKVDALTKQATSDKAQIDTLTAKAGDQEKELTDTKESLAKWKTAFEALQATAKKVEAERAKFADQSVLLKRTVEDREAKNRELYHLGNEILTRYEKFSLGEALTAKEPFTRLTRVKLENLVQDYGDKLADQRVKQ
jgi:chromosome segregation ATPase